MLQFIFHGLKYFLICPWVYNEYYAYNSVRSHNSIIIIMTISSPAPFSISTKLQMFTNFVIMLFIFCLPFTIFYPLAPSWFPEIYPLYVTPGFYIHDVLIFVLLVLFLLQYRKRNLDFRKLICFETTLLALVLLAEIISISNAMSVPLAIYTTIRWTVTLLAGFLLFFLVEKKSQILKFFALSLILQLVVGVIQIIIRGPIGLPFELALPPSNSRAAILYWNNFQFYRPYGFTFHPNVFGGLMIVGVLISTQVKERIWKKTLIPLFLLGVIISFSRSAWVALLITGTPLLFWQLKSQKLRLLATKKNLFVLACFTIILLIISPFIFDRLSFYKSWSESSSILARGQLIEIALSAIAQNPFRGIGAGNFPVYMRQFATFDLPHYVHNIPLLFASECGILSGLAWLILWLAPLFQWALKQPLIKARYPLIAAWLAIGLIGLWDNYPATLDNFRILSIFILVLVIKERNETPH